MTKIGLPFLILLYLYPLTFKALPFLSTKKIMAVVGILLGIVKIFNKFSNSNFLIKKELIYIFISLLLIGTASIGTVIYNDTNDFQFLNYVVSNVIIFASAYFIIIFAKSSKIEVSENYIIKLIVYSIALQCLISITMHFIPSLKELILNLTITEDTQAELLDSLSEERVIGFGLSFFWAGAYCGMGLIFISYLIRIAYIENRRLIFFVIMYAFIFVIGMMMARTTIIGAALSVLLFVLPRQKSSRSNTFKRIKFLGLLLVLPISTLFIIYFIFPKFFIKINYLIEFAFEMFINVKDQGTLRTDSTDVLMQMFTLPDNLKTWIIGDGYWDSPLGDGYYMHTDVGFLRIIYYFGLLGLFSFMLSQFIILKSSFKDKIIILIIFSYFILLNVKGYFEYTPFFALLIATHYPSKRYLFKTRVI